MDLFTPIVNEDKQHPNFKFLTQSNVNEPERKVIKEWANGFYDRDGKFIKEFQQTFNSSFWELYIFACLKELGCHVDFSYKTPDFVVNSPYQNFVAEASIANAPDGFRPEWDTNLNEIKNLSIEYILRLSTIRLVNAIEKKYNKYISNYSKDNHVQNKPFIICISPFDQPFFYFQDSLAITRVLYGYDGPITITNNEKNEISILGEARRFHVQKRPGSNKTLGLFTDSRMPEVSAIIFNNKATFSKVRALSKRTKEDGFFIFSGSRIIQSEKLTGTTRFCKFKSNYQETLLDGLHILLNPFANYPLDLRLFNNKEVAIHSYDPKTDSYSLNIPDNFLTQRICQTIFPKDANIKFKQSTNSSSYETLPPEVWKEDQLFYVGGYSGPFKDNYMAHYRGWTIIVSFDSIDKDWGAQAVNCLCYNMIEYTKANQNKNKKSIMNFEWFSEKESAYIAIKQKIDEILDS